MVGGYGRGSRQRKSRRQAVHSMKTWKTKMRGKGWNQHPLLQVNPPTFATSNQAPPTAAHNVHRFKVLNPGEMTFICLNIRCLYAFLLSIPLGCTSSSNVEIEVNPPRNFEIVDPGYLGYLCMKWQTSTSVNDFKECTVEYELQYRNGNSQRWKTIITKNLYYKDGFDLNYDVEAKVRTLLSPECVNGSKVQSLWSEATYKTSEQELDKYEGLQSALQCVSYIKTNGKNFGCKFLNLQSPDYKDFFVLVNGTSEFKPIRSSYFIFQLENIVKPLPPDSLTITMSDSSEVNMKWNVPTGPIPAKCFIYEISFSEDSIFYVFTTFDNEVSITKTLNKSENACFSVRSKVSMYCADDGIWSDRSEDQCLHEGMSDNNRDQGAGAGAVG
ncbi:interleukin-13 receptor subunit alpha-2 [Ctenodactylus gundi]